MSVTETLFRNTVFCGYAGLSRKCHVKSKKHLTGFFRHAAISVASAPSRCIAAQNDARQVKEVLKDTANERIKSAEGVFPVIFP